MIIKGNIRKDGGSLGNYLLCEGSFAKNLQKHERVEVWEASGIEYGDTLQNILADFDRSAIKTQCEKPLFHVQIRLDENEQLNREQFLESINRLEQRLELSGNERTIVAHTLEGEGPHVHIVWNRINYMQEKAAELKYFKNKCTDLARELEKEFGLRELSASKQNGKLSRDEERQAIRHGQAPQELKDDIRECWQESDCGKTFAASLEERGFMLAAGDRRDFVIVDEMGGTYSVARLTGSKAAEVRARLSDIDREALPGVEEAKDIQFDRYHGNRSAREEMEWEDGLAEAGIRKAEDDEIRERDEKRKNRERREGKKHAHKMAKLYSKADMVTMQQDAMRHLKELQRHAKIKQKHEAEKARLEDRIRKLEAERQGQNPTPAPGDPLPPLMQTTEPERQEERKEESQSEPTTDFWARVQKHKANEQEEKRDRTEQTDTRQNKAGRADFWERARQNREKQEGRDRDDGHERELEL